MKKVFFMLLVIISINSCATTSICKRGIQKCEGTSIMVCTGSTWELLHDCKDYDVPKKCSNSTYNQNYKECSDETN